jgi:hypothetical protein
VRAGPRIAKYCLDRIGIASSLLLSFMRFSACRFLCCRAVSVWIRYCNHLLPRHPVLGLSPTDFTSSVVNQHLLFSFHDLNAKMEIGYGKTIDLCELEVEMFTRSTFNVASCK